MIKMIIFDLDGVLIDARDIHYEALNEALNDLNTNVNITYENHIKTFDGLPTTEKLVKLHDQFGLDKDKFDSILKKKQQITIEKIKKIDKNQELIETMRQLKQDGYILCIASNSVSETIHVACQSLGISQFITDYVSNQNVSNRKPSPDMYQWLMRKYKVKPKETLILEDSPVGIKAVHASNAHLLQIHCVCEVKYDIITDAISEANRNSKEPQIKWQNKRMNVVIPMAGNGDRFKRAGYNKPKPLVDVAGFPMIKRVVDSLNIDATYTFIVRAEHYEKYNLDTILNLIAPKCNVVVVDRLTEGAACTVLLAKKFINNKNPLLIVNSDQIVDFDSVAFLYDAEYRDVDGSILVFNDSDPKWSFAEVNDSGYVNRVAEKNPISDLATVGIYYWKHGKDFVASANQMIDKGIRTNNEFYVCPVYNEAILNGLKVRTFQISRESMHGVGTPEDLNKYLGEISNVK